MHEPVPLHLREFSVVRYLLTDQHPIVIRNCIYTEERDDLFDMHYELEFGIVLSGKTVRQYLDWEIELSSGGIWFHPALEPHGCRITDAPCDLFVFIIQPELLERAGKRGHSWLQPFQLPPQERPRGSQQSKNELIRIANRLTEMAGEGRSDIDQWAEVLLFEALLVVNDSLPNERHDEVDASPYVASDIQPALSRVYESRCHVPVNDAAAACNMSRQKFAQRFAELMGMSFPKFALTHRLNGAATQLSSTEDPIKSVALDWGFRDMSHLTKCFTTRFGVTPGEYRRRNARAATSA